MKITQLDDAPLVRGLEHRGGTFHSRTMAEGVPGTPGNFKFSLSWLGTDYSGPRHRHNFDQVRVALNGAISYGIGRVIETGDIGYFPEGLHYGPTEQDMMPGKAQIVLQAGGASGLGYLSSFQTKRAQEELAQVGTFKDGLFHWPSQHPVNPGKVQDAYEALWEHVHQREIEYPAPRYADQVIMSPAAFV